MLNAVSSRVMNASGGLPYTLFSKIEYLDWLIESFKKAGSGSRILLMSMSFDVSEPKIAAVLKELEAAATRGAQITLGIDARDFISNGSKLGPLFWHNIIPQNAPQPYHDMQTAIEAIDAHGTALAKIINLPSRKFSLPVAGRSHIKIAIIDDYVIVGGCNLDDPQKIDMMIGWRSIELSEKLFKTLQKAILQGNVREALTGIDQRLSINSGSQLLIDAGVRNQSVIFEEALGLIDAAEQWLTITCQFFPNSVTAQHLLRAMQRGVTVNILYSSPSHRGIIGRLGQQYSNAIERLRLPRVMFDNELGDTYPLLHAKVIACDKGLIIGSHNYVRAGVILGTAEIAFMTNDAALARQAVQKLNIAIQHCEDRRMDGAVADNDTALFGTVRY